MNSHHHSIQQHWSLILIYLTLPITLWALLLLQPTCDDWTYITTPLVDEKWDPTLFLPSNNYWRPFDALIGSLLAMAPAAFPALNHILILSAHAASATAVNRLCHIMQTSHRARNNATIMFYCSTGMQGTVLGVAMPLLLHRWMTGRRPTVLKRAVAFVSGQKRTLQKTI